ncbi:MAG: UDP-N-acetylmuramoyl-L-alanyl-D-glutamate--2,6-diaminopimelate ligase [Actinomycetota bacterium]
MDVTGRRLDALVAELSDAGLAVELVGATSDDAGEIVVRGATHDSREVAAGDLFVCLRGAAFDGHDFAADVAAAGATALLVDHPLDVDVAQLVVDDTRIAAGPVAAAVHGRPSRSLTGGVVGVTGTNGKTTVTELLATALDALGRRVGAVGTLRGARTTPEATDLQALLARFVDEGSDSAVMEVSSHALELHRVDGTEFDVVAFTNLGHDHLDLHGTHEAYFRAKARLFDGTFAPRAVINIDDVHGSLLAIEAASHEHVEVAEVSRQHLSDVTVTAHDHRYRWRDHDVVVRIGGHFNVDNSHLVLEILVALGVDPADAAQALSADVVVPGRFELIDHPAATARALTVVVDYAHTPDGLEQLFDTCRAVLDPLASDSSTPDRGSGPGRLVAVYGCGGDRDREKRPAMAAVGAERCDRVVFTSDNPRHEDPQSIIDDMWSGVAEQYRRRVHSIVDRREAIDEALRMAQSGDLVVIAGRGHESVQDHGDHRVEFDDRDVARDLLSLLEPST